MLKIVFQNPDAQPKPSVAETYRSIISSNISGTRCTTHDKVIQFELVFSAPNTYLIEITACCDEFKSIMTEQIGRMLS